MVEEEVLEEPRCVVECPLLGVSKWLRDFGKEVKGALPEEFWEHRRAARRETLLALRSLLDVAIERTEKRERSAKKRTRIEIS